MANPPQYSCLENLINKGVWQVIVQGVQRVGHERLNTQSIIIIFILKVKSLNRVRLFVTPWTAAYQGPWDFPGKITGVRCRRLLSVKGQSTVIQIFETEDCTLNDVESLHNSDLGHRVVGHVVPYKIKKMLSLKELSC